MRSVFSLDRFIFWRPLSKSKSRRYTGHEMRNDARYGVRCLLYGVTKMEKWLVVTGVWMMFATCMVLFIRGATGVSRRELIPVEVRDGEHDAKAESMRG